ncbi:hypothetical protein [Klebsiella grimontii]|uniref:hypothetical protein n=1 Tax=Klebsiella grimontii TaxID=2058152 RepID=UPI0012B82072|nr:hypothetical protein [Klebsiella grimontii]MBD0904356.1 hypothetical protein [Klebsiella grimontii]
MNITKTPAMLKRNPLSRKEKNVMKVVFYVSLPTCKGLRNSLGFGVWGLGFGVWGLGFGVWGLGFGVWGLGFGSIFQFAMPGEASAAARQKYLKSKND